MSWLGGYKAKPSASKPTESEIREEKRKKLEAEREARNKRREAQRKQLQQAIESREEATKALEELNQLAPDIFDGTLDAEMSAAEEEAQRQREEAARVAAQRAARPPRIKFEDADEPDGEDYFKNLGMIKLKWDSDVTFWFNSIEASLRRATVNSQWTKRETLMHLLPEHVMAEVKYLFCLDQDDAGDFPYRDIKHEVIKLFGPKPQDAIDRALSRVMVGRPSQLAKQLMDDLCKCRPVLKTTCCQNMIFGLWRRQLSTAVRNSVAGMSFDQNSYQAVLDHADQVHYSNKFDNPSKASVAAISVESSSEEVSVAAISTKNRGRGGNRGNRGRNRGGQTGGGNQSSQPKPAATVKGPRHPDGPPSGVCQIHHSYGKSAWWCLNPHSCPWKNYTTPRPGSSST